MISFNRKLSTKFDFLVNNVKDCELLARTPCLLCSQITHNKSKICSSCRNDLTWNDCACVQCSHPIKLSEQNSSERLSLICGDCISSPPPFTESFIPLVYDFPIDRIILNMKYGKERYWLKTLGALFVEALGKQSPLKYPDLLVPVPIHKTKRRLRGFNQAELLAKQISRETHIPMLNNVLYKTKETPNQASLNKLERLRNLKGCFGIKHPDKIQSKHIVLVDDVMTSKATAEICSHLLLKNGATRVDVWCVARTPKFR